MDFIYVVDCDVCLHPYWEDELINGVCVGCKEFEEEWANQKTTTLVQRVWRLLYLMAKLIYATTATEVIYKKKFFSPTKPGGVL